MAGDLDHLADLPPEKFVAARDQLAKRLKAEGQRERAAEVKKLRKPAVSDWIVGQVRRHHADVVDTLRTASLAVAKAQESLLATGDRDGLRRAVADRQDARQALLAVVDQNLARHGRPPSYRDEAVSTIESGVTAEVTSGGFGLPADFELPDRPAPGPVRDLAAEREAAEALAAVTAAEARLQRAQDELQQAEALLEAARERHRRLIAG